MHPSSWTENKVISSQIIKKIKRLMNDCVFSHTHIMLLFTPLHKSVPYGPRKVIIDGSPLPPERKEWELDPLNCRMESVTAMIYLRNTQFRENCLTWFFYRTGFDVKLWPHHHIYTRQIFCPTLAKGSKMTHHLNLKLLMFS